MSRFLIGADWDDAVHLTDEAKASLLASIPAYQQDARSKGIPQLGAGAIYPLAESDLRVADFEIPAHFARGYGMDVGGGAKPTAAAFGAMDRDAGILYITSVYKKASNEPSLHAEAIKSRMGGWKWAGVGDAAALILTEHDAEQLVNVYRNLGMDLMLADKSVETGIKEVWDLMVLGRFKVFASCIAWWEEFRMYQRDKHGRVKKTNDHLLDASRYLVRSGRARMKTKPVVPTTTSEVLMDEGAFGLGWMGGAIFLAMSLGQQWI
jgi:hypothetical protein